MDALTVGDNLILLVSNLVDQDGAAIDLSGGGSAVCHLSLNGVTTTKTATVNNPGTAGVVQYALTSSDIRAAGQLIYRFTATTSGGGKYTGQKFYLQVSDV